MSLTATNLHLWRGDRHVLRGVSFALAPGQALHVCGPNGSGKTTLLRVACGLLHAEEGELMWQGQRAHTAHSGFLSQLAYLGHDTGLKGDLTALENLGFSTRLHQKVSAAQLLAALTRLQVQDCAQLPCRVLSAGQRRRVALSRLLLAEAKLWVLDEPYTNLDAGSSAEISSVLNAHLEAGGMLLIAAHQDLQLPAAATRRLELS